MKVKIIQTLVALIFTIGCFAQKGDIRKLDIDLSNYDYPYPVSYMTFNSQQQDLKMAYMDVKPTNYNGHNVMLLHGKNFNGAYWETTINALAKAGYRVIVPDQIGFGKSTKPAHYQFTFQQLATNTKTLLDTIGVEKISVLGHSMGGMVATRFALMFPETVEKFILENPIGLEDWKLVVPYKTIDWWYDNELKKDYESIKNYQKESYYDGNWKPEYDKWVNVLAGWTLNEEDYPKIAWDAALTYDMIFTQPVVYEFKNITNPTLLIIGTRDRTALGKPLVSDSVRATMGRYDQLGKATRDKIKNAELVEIPNIGHLPHIEAFDQFIKPLLEFLNK
ncbi:alpha/beta fold hydrolase [Leeuwenhoekiella sp. A16]|uniref:alpha/beta fold hydrolase n=1 Tax=unclassified Leeuwenhoekiella TaxID=2615029 RepID=UPI003A813BFB